MGHFIGFAFSGRCRITAQCDGGAQCAGGAIVGARLGTECFKPAFIGQVYEDEDRIIQAGAPPASATKAVRPQAGATHQKQGKQGSHAGAQ